MGAGYIGRRAGFGQQAARTLSYAVILGPYTMVGLLALWGLDFQAQLLLLPVMGFVLMGLGIFIGCLTAPWLGLGRSQQGTYVLACGTSNLGFTLGGSVSFVLFGEPGLAIASIYVMFWNVGVVFQLFPVARRYGTGPKLTPLQLLWANVRDIRCLPLPATILGLTLNLCGVERPAFVTDFHLISIFIIAGAIIAFFTTGLRLSFARVHQYLSLYAILAIVKFLVVPACAGLVLWIAAWTGHPFSPLASAVVLIQASTAVGIYTVLIANLFHLDDELASLLFTVNTVLYLLLVLPLLTLLFGALTI